MNIPVILLVAFVVVLGAIAVARSLIRLCQPNEVLVISGSRRWVGDKKVGYKLVQGGRAFVLPLFERVDRLDVTNMIIDIRAQGAYSKGGIPLTVEGVANVKIASVEPIIGNAIERFLGKKRFEIMAVARETLEGNLRGVLATLTPEEVNQDRVKFAQSLLMEAGEDLRRLGIVLDTLKIQHVSDDRGYLDSIGRKQSAELQMRSRVAEAENRALSQERSAENFEDKEIRRVMADIELAKADAGKQLIDAQTKKVALVAEQEAHVEALVAKAQASLEVERARCEQVRLQLQADVIEPADAKRRQLIEKARGRAASIREEGKATASALRSVHASWNGQSKRVFVAQKLGTLVSRMMDTVQKTQIDEIRVVDAELARGDGLAGKLAAAGKVLEAAGNPMLGSSRRLGLPPVPKS